MSQPSPSTSCTARASSREAEAVELGEPVSGARMRPQTPPGRTVGRDAAGEEPRDRSGEDVSAAGGREARAPTLDAPCGARRCGRDAVGGDDGVEAAGDLDEGRFPFVRPAFRSVIGRGGTEQHRRLGVVRGEHEVGRQTAPRDVGQHRQRVRVEDEPWGARGEHRVERRTGLRHVVEPWADEHRIGVLECVRGPAGDRFARIVGESEHRRLRQVRAHLSLHRPGHEQRDPPGPDAQRRLESEHHGSGRASRRAHDRDVAPRLLGVTGIGKAPVAEHRRIDRLSRAGHRDSRGAR